MFMQASHCCCVPVEQYDPQDVLLQAKSALRSASPWLEALPLHVCAHALLDPHVPAHCRTCAQL